MENRVQQLAIAGLFGKRVTKDLQSSSGSINFTKSKIYDIIKEKGENKHA